MPLAYQTDPLAAAAAIRAQGSVALDLETFGPSAGDGLDPWRGSIRLMTLAVPGHTPWALDLQQIPRLPQELKDALEAVPVIAHHARFDALWLAVRLDIRPRQVFCTLTASRLLTAGLLEPNGLDDVLERHLKIPPGADHSVSDWGGFFLTDEQITYALRDVIHLHELRKVLEKQIAAAGLRAVCDLEMELLPVVTAMEEAGIAVDVAKLQELRDDALRNQQAASALVADLLKTPALNASSPKQLLAALARAGVNLKDTNESTLRAADDGRIIPAILNFRSIEKTAQQAQTLMDAVRGDGRIHSRFDPTGTDTGRFSSHSPNLQNISRGPLRSCFIAPPGSRLVVADYNQVELRAAASLAGEEKMIEAYRMGGDLHRLTASAILGKDPAAVTKEDRQIAKSANFGLLYGQGAQGLVSYAENSYGVKLTVPEALAIRTRFFATYPALARWHAECWKSARAKAAEARTTLGRRRLISAGSNSWHRFTALVNTPVQGGCADGLKMAMIALARSLPEGARMVSTVHDELIVECPLQSVKDVREAMDRSMPGPLEQLFPGVPIGIEVAVGENWGEK